MIQILAALGFNVPYLVAGFSGGVVMLTFVSTNRPRAIAACLGGALVANYLASVLQFYVKAPDVTALGCAFICGLIAPKIAKGIYNRGSKWENNEEPPPAPPPQP